MQFIYLDPEGNPCGPVDESDIVKMIQEGTITRDTAIRNTLLPEFRTVAEIDNFKEALEQAPDAEAYREIPVELGVIERLKLASQPDRAKAESTAYQGKFRVSDATFQHRLYAALFDCLIFAVVGALLCIPGFSCVSGIFKIPGNIFLAVKIIRGQTDFLSAPGGNFHHRLGVDHSLFPVFLHLFRQPGCAF